MAVIVALWLGILIGAVSMSWALLTPRGEKTVIDKWWLKNESRWLDLRDQLLKEEAEKS